MIIIQHYTAGYSTIPEESRKACNMPPQYGFEHVIYRFYPLCGSKVLLEEVLQSCTEPGLWWKPVKDKNGQNTPHFSEKNQQQLVTYILLQPIFEWAFCLGLSQAQRWGAVRLRCSLISAGCRDESTFNRASHRCRPAWENGRLSSSTVLYFEKNEISTEIVKLLKGIERQQNANREAPWTMACASRISETTSTESSRICQDYLDSRGHWVSIPSICITSLPIPRYPQPSPSPTWRSSDNAMLPKSRWASGCVLGRCWGPKSWSDSHIIRVWLDNNQQQHTISTYQTHIKYISNTYQYSMRLNGLMVVNSWSHDNDRRRMHLLSSRQGKQATCNKSDHIFLNSNLTNTSIDMRFPKMGVPQNGL